MASPWGPASLSLLRAMLVSRCGKRPTRKSRWRQNAGLLSQRCACEPSHFPALSPLSQHMHSSQLLHLFSLSPSLSTLIVSILYPMHCSFAQSSIAERARLKSLTVPGMKCTYACSLYKYEGRQFSIGEATGVLSPDQDIKSTATAVFLPLLH